MKALILAALLATSSPEAIVLPSGAGVFVVQPATLRVYENVNKMMQVDMLVDLSTASGVSRGRVGVSGCSDGRGQLARVDDDGTPIAAPNNWTLGGSRVYDVLASAICAAAQSHREPARPGARMT